MRVDSTGDHERDAGPETFGHGDFDPAVVIVAIGAALLILAILAWVIFGERPV